MPVVVVRDQDVVGNIGNRQVTDIGDRDVDGIRRRNSIDRIVARQREPQITITKADLRVISDVERRVRNTGHPDMVAVAQVTTDVLVRKHRVGNHGTDLAFPGITGENCVQRRLEVRRSAVTVDPDVITELIPGRRNVVSQTHFVCERLSGLVLRNTHFHRCAAVPSQGAIGKVKHQVLVNRGRLALGHGRADDIDDHTADLRRLRMG